jgi:hypothetical protein
MQSIIGDKYTFPAGIENSVTSFDTDGTSSPSSKQRCRMSSFHSIGGWRRFSDVRYSQKVHWSSGKVRFRLIRLYSVCLHARYSKIVMVFVTDFVSS